MSANRFDYRCCCTDDIKIEDISWCLTAADILSGQLLKSISILTALLFILYRKVEDESEIWFQNHIDTQTNSP